MPPEETGYDLTFAENLSCTGVLVFLVLFQFIASKGLPLIDFGEASGLEMLVGFWFVGLIIHLTLPAQPN